MINDFDIKGDLGDIDPFKKEDGEEVSLNTVLCETATPIPAVLTLHQALCGDEHCQHLVMDSRLLIYNNINYC